MTVNQSADRTDMQLIVNTLKMCSESTVQRIADVLTGYVMAETNKAEHYDRKDRTNDE